MLGCSCWACRAFHQPVMLAAEAPEPGTPLCEHVAEINSRLREIEAERAKERQAGTVPDAADVTFKKVFGE